MLALGSPIPPFSLPDTGGITVSGSDFAAAKGLVVAFFCNHCPYVKLIKHAFALYAAEHMPKGIAVVAINSNDIVSHPEDAPARMAEDKRKFAYPFPYLFDETQAVAKAFRAACTPDFFLFGSEGTLVYRGQFDSTRPGMSGEPTGADLRTATRAVILGQPAPAQQLPSLGCNIKWKPGNAPDYFRA